MPYKATIVDLPDVNLVVRRAHEFPSGIKAAWDDLESRLPSLKGRKFYGLAVCEGSQVAYFAGVQPASDEEVASLGLPTMMIRGGEYARVKLFDWQNHTDKIGEIFDELMRDYPVNPDCPSIDYPSVEYYRSQSELHLLMPLARSKG